jgi:hypothetical protein
MLLGVNIVKRVKGTSKNGSMAFGIMAGPALSSVNER